jgi:hypothetical protein
MPLHKDEALDTIAAFGNVAQFISLRPEGNELVQAYSRVSGYAKNHVFPDLKSAIATLLGLASDRSVNVRSYSPDSPRSREFVYGLSTVDDVIATVNRLGREGLHLIINETIDVNDGGVSGVVQGDTVEFAPDDTPRCVEKSGVASLPLGIAQKLFRLVYGFDVEFESRSGLRTEFSIHPKPRGHRSSHIIIWEREEGVPDVPEASLAWPNRFSRHIGDKAYGLLMAYLLGVPVPRTLVIGRRIAPFTFGSETGSHEVWIRTCPTEPLPGFHTTSKGWLDPFLLLAQEDPSGKKLPSVLCQAAVTARYSGAAVVGANGRLLVEGKQGEGDRFMLGAAPPETLPDEVLTSVSAINTKFEKSLGPVRFEWVHDGERTWVVQLHRGGTDTGPGVIVPGAAVEWADFEVASGLEELRSLLARTPADIGVRVIGAVGLTSHVADLLRKSGRPSILLDCS